MRKLTIVLALLMFSSPAWGKDVTIKKLLESYDLAPLEAKELMHDMMRHQEMGMSWSNTFLKEMLGKKPLYCKPKNLGITGEQAFQIFRDSVNSIKTHNKFVKGESASYAGLYLLVGLMKTFPCK